MIDIEIPRPLFFLRGASFFILLLVLSVVTGCGPASPRFVSKDPHAKSTAKEKKEKSEGVRFSSTVVEEETKEDDKKVDVKSVEQRFAVNAAPASVEKVNPPKGEIAPPSPATDTAPVSPAGFGKQKMMDAILGWMGTPYAYGGSSKGGIDCSGFAREIFRESAGMELPRTTEDQSKLGTPVSKDDLKFGDLVFFNTTGQDPSHVGIYIGDEMFAHSSVSFGVTLSSMYSSYYKKRYTSARRVLP